jgi:hypothetical protein
MATRNDVQAILGKSSTSIAMLRNPVHQPIEIGREPFITVGRVSYASFRL